MNILVIMDLKFLSFALILVLVSIYQGKWVLIQLIILKEGFILVRMKVSINVSINSQFMGDVGYILFFIWFCLMYIK